MLGISELELMVGIEPTTFSLRVRCSAIEPHQRIHFSGKRQTVLLSANSLANVLILAQTFRFVNLVFQFFLGPDRPFVKTRDAFSGEMALAIFDGIQYNVLETQKQ